MWEALIRQKNEWIGGELRDYGDPQDRRFSRDKPPWITRITDIELDGNVLTIHGEDFDCGGALDVLGVTGMPEFPCENGLPFRGYGGHEFHIVKPVSVCCEECGKQPAYGNEQDGYLCSDCEGKCREMEEEEQRRDPANYCKRCGEYSDILEHGKCPMCFEVTGYIL